jgi:hypothetical protein
VIAHARGALYRLRQEKAELDVLLHQTIADDSQLKAAADLLACTPGVGPVLVATLLAELQSARRSIWRSSAPAAAAPAPPPGGRRLLQAYYWEQSWGVDRARAWRTRLTAWEHMTLDATLEHKRLHGREPNRPAAQAPKTSAPLKA